MRCFAHFFPCFLLLACSGGGAARNLDRTTAGPVANDAGRVAPTPAASIPERAAPMPEGGPSRGGGDAAAEASSPPDAGKPTSDAASPPACEPCAQYPEAKLLARVQPAELAELSGMAASWRNPGVLFAHNDRARSDVYALASDGALLEHFVFEGAQVVDVEDVGVGPCPTGTCVVLADIGDNQAVRAEVAILRALEPEVSAANSAGGAVSLAFERFRFAYEDGPHNAEGLLVDPGSGALYVVTKRAAGEPSSVYALTLPLDPDQLNQAVRVAELDVPRAGDQPATAAASHPCGVGFALRTGNALYEFRIPAGAEFESAFAAEPQLLSSGDEPQSEAVSYWPDGRGIVTSGESASAPIYESACRPP